MLEASNVTRNSQLITLFSWPRLRGKVGGYTSWTEGANFVSFLSLSFLLCLASEAQGTIKLYMLDEKSWLPGTAP